MSQKKDATKNLNEELSKLQDENKGLESDLVAADDLIGSLRTEIQDLKASLDAFVGAPLEEEVVETPLKDVLKVVKRTKTVMVKKDGEEVSEEREYVIKPDEVVSFKTYPDRFVVVTKNGQKFSAVRE